VIVRADLPPEQIIVQSCHAVERATSNYSRDGPPLPVPNLIVLAVPTERDLLSHADRLQENGIPLSVFQEPDIGNQATALATGIVRGDARKLFRNLKLIKFQGVSS
jgi:hypothetical protein